MKGKKLRSIVIDDSSLQRMAVAKLIKDHINLHLVADYEDVIAAKKGMENKEIDLIFLDIEMPIINGFEFIESTESLPQIILITSKPDYAFQAFDYDVTDYLLKPITKQRFDASVKRAVAKAIKPVNKTDTEENHLYVSSNLKKVKIVLHEIKWIEGLGDYIKIITDDANILVLSTMRAFMNKLPESKFLRIHKSYIINLDKVEKYSSTIVEINAKQIPLSRYKKVELEDKLLNLKHS